MKGIWSILAATGKFVIGFGGFMVGIVAIIGLAFIAFSNSGNQTAPSVPDGAVLVLWPEGQIVEIAEHPDPLEEYFDTFNRRQRQTSIHDITTALKRAKNDDRIAALALVTESMFGAAPSHQHTIAAAVRDFKESGKKVYAISAAYSQSDYLIAAEADKIFMNPQGNVLLSGFARYRLYYKSLLEKIGANVNVFRVGTFKSAVEPYIRDDMSEAAKEANTEFLGGLWDQYSASVEKARTMEPGTLNTDISNISADLKAAGGDLAQLALNSGFVDALAPNAVWREELKEEYGESNYGDSFKQIHHEAYLAATSDNQSSANEIAIITAQGEIVPGEGPVSVAAADTIVGYIRSARNNPNTAAIVLRVDSPGGSAFASEQIRQALVTAQNQGIEVIASFGPVAASGGYWISATADEIWAEPSTITGSIGIFGVVPTYEGTLAKFGVNSDGVGTSELAGAFDVTRPLNDVTKDVIQQSIESGYDQFLELVAKGRDMTVERVDQIGQGRVWLGTTAKELGLVDQLGGLDDAVSAAARAADVEGDYRTVFYMEAPDPIDQLVADILNSTVGIDDGFRTPETPALRLMEQVRSDIELLGRLNDPAGRYVICFECKIR